MRTAPADLIPAILADALRSWWRFPTSELRYRPVGFGSHHWLAVAPDHPALFVTVDDLTVKWRADSHGLDAAFERLAQAFDTTRSLGEAGLRFVVAPLPAVDGQLLHRLTERYSVVVHPMLAGEPAGDGQYRAATDRDAVLDLLTELHGVAVDAPVDDFVVPGRAELTAALSDIGRPWRTGPYGESARRLLDTHAAGVAALLTAYDGLARQVAGHPERFVVTHGEPHAGNVLVTPEGVVLIDWDTVMAAPPERDLWSLVEEDRGVLDRYAAATGRAVDRVALDAYRLWYDLAEIAGYVSLFRAPHGRTADTAGSWHNLQYFLRPGQRWPTLLPHG
jgi:spectinomycin phosphotransferase